MSRRADLTVGQPLTNALAVYYPVAPADAPHAVVCVSHRVPWGTWLCHSCYRENKPYDCPHVAAVKKHLQDQQAAPAAAA